jgi:beta-propeller uncharacterized protein DUF5122
MKATHGLVVLALLAGSVGAAYAQSPDTSLWVTDGDVKAAVLVGGTLYVGGAFSRVGPYLGSGVPFDASTGQPQQPFARVSGAVNVVLADGSGGWFVGGRFAGVAGAPRRNLVHLLSNGSPAAWAPDPDSEVFALALSGSTLYVGGKFEHMGGQPRYKIGAVDVSSGLATAFDPSPAPIAINSWPYIRSLAVGPGVVYAGGFFYTIGGASRVFLAALDPVSGDATAWDALSNGQANAIVAAGSSVYVGGYFSNIGGASRSGLAELTASNATATAWDPHPDGGVLCIDVTATAIYAGGAFHHMGLATRNSAAAFDRGTGALAAFDANAQGGQFGSSPVYALAVQGGSLYLAGEFTSVGGQARGYLAALDATTGAAQAWDPHVNRAAMAVAAAGSTVFAGGNFWIGDGEPRTNLAAYDLATGHPTSWAPVANGAVWTMATDGASLYLGGFFTLLQGQTHRYLAKLDVASAAAAAWDPGASDVVTCMALAGSTLYVGGYFTNVGGGGAPTLAAVDVVTGNVLPWIPATHGGPVNSVVADPANNAVMAASQGGMWRFRASDGATLSTVTFDPSGVPATLLLVGSTLYVGGRYASINGQPRSNLAAIDAASNTVLPWAPEPNSIVNSLATDGTRIFIAGQFSSVVGQPRRGFAVLDGTSGALGSFDARLDDADFYVTLAGPDLFLSGRFGSCQGVAAPGWVRLAVPPLSGPHPTEPPVPLRLEAAPVPAVDGTVLRLRLPTLGVVWLDVLDLQGRRVATVLSGVALTAGIHAYPLDTRGWKPGVYLARLRTRTGSVMRRIVVER